MLLGRMIEQSARRFPERTAVEFEGSRISFADFDRMTNALGRALQQRGVRTGDRVAISLANRPELLVGFFAAQKIGAVAVLLNYGLKARELQFIAEDCNPSVWLFDQFSAGSFRELLNCGALSSSSLVACSQGNIPGSSSYSELIMNGGQAERLGRPDIVPGSPSLIMYTSGTTGKPKGVVLSHAAQWVNTVLMVAELTYRNSDRALQIAPLYHVAAFHVVALPLLLVGGCNILIEKYDANRVGQVAAASEVTTILGAPTHFEMWSRAEPILLRDNENFKDRIRHLMFTGAPIRADTLKWMEKNLSDQIWNVYGQTEACSLITIVPPDQLFRITDINCIGRPLLGVDVGIASVDRSGREQEGDWKRGELVCRAPKMMNEYYNSPDKTRDKFADGWLRTGDLVEVDDDGYYYYLGRVDELIITGGENVYPAEIETFLVGHPAVKDCVVIGLTEEVWGQTIAAYVVPESGDFSLADIEEFSRSGLATHKRPRRWYVVDEIPRSPAGKVLANVLRRTVQNEERTIGS